VSVDDQKQAASGGWEYDGWLSFVMPSSTLHSNSTSTVAISPGTGELAVFWQGPEV